MKIQIRQDIAANWSSNNTILANGELGLVTDGDHKGHFKVGDGTTPWNDLSFFVGPHTHSSFVSLSIDDTLQVGASTQGAFSAQVEFVGEEFDGKKGIVSVAQHHDSPSLPGALMALSRTRGTRNSPEALQEDDNIGAFQLAGWNGSNPIAGAAWEAYASEDWDGSTTGTTAIFKVVKKGSIYASPRLTFTGEGKTFIHDDYVEFSGEQVVLPAPTSNNVPALGLNQYVLYLDEANNKFILKAKKSDDTEITQEVGSASGESSNVISTIADYETVTKTGANCLTFNGTNNSITIPGSSDFNLGSDDFIISCFLNYNSFNTRNFILNQTGTNQRALMLETDGSGNLKLAIATDGASGASWNYYYSNGNLSINTDYHIVYVRENGNLSLYINGIRDKRAAFNITQDASPANLEIGTQLSGGTYYYNSNFKMWGVLIKKGETSSEITNKIINGDYSTITDAALLLPMAEGKGDTTYDVSGKNNHGTIEGTLTSIWGNTQDVFHWNNDKGFSFDTEWAVIDSVSAESTKTGNEVTYLIDRNTGGTHWHSLNQFTELWIKAEFTEPRIVTSTQWVWYINTAYMSDKIELFGSNDDSNYTKLGEAEPDRVTPNYTTNLDCEYNPTAYKYYKLIFTSSDARYYMGFEWKLFVSDSFNALIPALADGSLDAEGNAIQHPTNADGLITNNSESTIETTRLNENYNFKKISVNGTDINDGGLSNVAYLDQENQFTEFPKTPAAAPTTDYQVANKKYVDENGGGISAIADYETVTKTGANCATFDGSNDYVQITDYYCPKKDFTISMWVKRGRDNTEETIASHTRSTSEYGSFSSIRFEPDNTLKFNPSTSQADLGRPRTTETYTESSGWIYIEVGHSSSLGTSGKCFIRVNNGEIVLSVADVVEVTPQTISTSYPTVGVYDYNKTQNFKGSIAGYKVTNDITGDVILYLPFAENNGIINYDVSGNKNHGIIENASLNTFWGEQQNLFHYNNDFGFSKAMKFNGTNNYISVTSNDFNISDVSASPFEISFKINLQEDILAGSLTSFVTIGDADYRTLHIGSDAANKARIIYSINGSDWVIHLASEPLPNGWNEIVITRDVNGAYLLKSNGVTYIDVTDATDFLLDTYNLKIGAHYSLNSSYNIHDELIDFNFKVNGSTIVAYSGVETDVWTDLSGNGNDGTINGTSPNIIYIPALSDGSADAADGTILSPANANGLITNNSESTVETTRLNENYNFKKVSVNGTDINDGGLNNVAYLDQENQFTEFPLTPSSAPTTNYQVANKKYVDDNVGSGGLEYDTIFLGSNCGTFYGTNGYITIPDQGFGFASNFLISFEINLREISQAGLVYLGTSSNDFRILLEANGNIRVLSNTYGFDETYTNIEITPNKVWRVAVFKQSGHIFALAQEDGQSLISDVGISFAPLVAPFGPAFIGYNDSTYATLKGSIWRVRVVGHGFDNTDIFSILEGGEIADPSLYEMYLPIAEGAGNVVHDVSGNDHHGTITNENTFNLDFPDFYFWGNTQNVFSYNLNNGHTINRFFSIGSYASFEHDDSLNVVPNFTISAWVYVGEDILTYRPIIEKTPAEETYGLFIDGANNVFRFYFVSGVSNRSLSTPVVKGQWVHLLGCVNSSSYYFYKNNTLVTDANQSNFTSSTTGPLIIGGNNTSEPDARGLVVRDVRIYPTFLSSAQRAQVYNGDILGTEVFHAPLTDPKGVITQTASIYPNAEGTILNYDTPLYIPALLDSSAVADGQDILYPYIDNGESYNNCEASIVKRIEQLRIDALDTGIITVDGQPLEIDTSNFAKLDEENQFDEFPLTPQEEPTTDYQVVNKKYVDDNLGSSNIDYTISAKQSHCGSFYQPNGYIDVINPNFSFDGDFLIYFETKLRELSQCAFALFGVSGNDFRILLEVDGSIRIYSNALGFDEQYNTVSLSADKAWRIIVCRQSGNVFVIAKTEGEGQLLSMGSALAGTIEPTGNTRIGYANGVYDTVRGSIWNFKVIGNMVTNEDILALIGGNEITDTFKYEMYLPFAEGAANRVYDASGNNRHGLIYNENTLNSGVESTYFWNRTQDVFHYNLNYGHSISRFLDSSSYASFVHHPIIAFPLELSISVWVYIVEAPAGWRCVFEKYPMNGAYGFDIDGANNKFRLKMYINGSLRSLYSQTSYQAGRWYHLAGTFDGSTQKLYWNGSEDRTVSVSGSVASTEGPLYIAGADNGYSGDIIVRDLRIYTSVLSESDVLQVYNGDVLNSEAFHAPMTDVEGEITQISNAYPYVDGAVVGNDTPVRFPALLDGTDCADGQSLIFPVQNDGNTYNKCESVITTQTVNQAIRVDSLDASAITIDGQPFEIDTSNFATLDQLNSQSVSPDYKTITKTGANCLTFNGTDNYILSPSNSALHLTGDFEIEVYLSIVDTSEIVTIYGHPDSSVATNSVNFQWKGDVNSWRFSWWSTESEFRYDLPDTIVNGQWYNIKLNKTGNTITIYRDDVAVGTADFTGETYPSQSGNLQIGRRPDDVQYFNGSMAGFSIKKDGVQVLYYPMAEGTGNIIHDASGNGYHGVLNGTLTNAWANTQDTLFHNNDYGFSNCMFFDGVDDYVSVPTITLTVPHTIYIKLIPPNSTKDESLLGNNASGNYVGFRYIVQDSLEYRGSAGWGNPGVNKLTKDGRVHSVTAVRSANDWVEYFGDNTSLGNMEKSGGYGNFTFDTIGKRSVSAPLPFGGAILEVKCFDVALNQSQIAALNNGESIGIQPVYEYKNTGNEDSDWVERINGVKNGTVNGDPKNLMVPGLLDRTTDANGFSRTNPSIMNGTDENGSETILVSMMPNSAYDFKEVRVNGSDINDGGLSNVAYLDRENQFAEFPKTPESNPIHNFHVATKKYVDDNSVAWDYTTVKNNGNCIHLDASTGCIKTPNVVYDKIGTDDFSINFLVKRTGSDRGCIFAWGAAIGDDRNSIQIDIDELNDNFRFAVNHYVGGTKQTASSFEIVSNDTDGKILSDSSWYKCAVVRKNRTFYMYVNGVSVPYTNKYSSDLDNVSIEAFDYDWTIGQTEHGALQLDAYVSNIQFTVGALTDEDFQRVLKAESIKDFGKVISNYPLAEGAGGIVYESSGNGKSGYIEDDFTSAWGTTQDYVFYNNDQGFSTRRYFDGSTNYVSMIDGSGVGSTFIIAVKFLITDVSSNKKILTYRPSGSDRNEIRFEVASGKISATLVNSLGSGTGYKQYKGNTDIKMGVPYKAILSWDGTNLRLFLKEGLGAFYEDTPYAKTDNGTLSMTNTTRYRRYGANEVGNDRFSGILQDIKTCESYSESDLNLLLNDQEASAYSLHLPLDEIEGTAVIDASGNNSNGDFYGTSHVVKIPGLLNGLMDSLYNEIGYPSRGGGAITNGSETSVQTVRANEKYHFQGISLTSSDNFFKPNSGTTIDMNALTGMTGGEEYFNTDTQSKFIYNNNLSAWVEI